MFPRRRSRARQVHMHLPRGRQLEITIPSSLANRLPARKAKQRPQPAAVAFIAAIGAGLLYLVGLAARRRTMTRTEETPATTPPAHGIAEPSSERPGVTPAAQPPTSDREPDEIEQLTNLNSARRAGSGRH